jgi:Armadillo/beta-catenin-like repeat
MTAHLRWRIWQRIVIGVDLVSNKADIRKSGGIRALVKLLDSVDPDVKKSAALALSSLLDDCNHI